MSNREFFSENQLLEIAARMVESMFGSSVAHPNATVDLGEGGRAMRVADRIRSLKTKEGSKAGG